MWFVGLDVHAETTVISVRSSQGVVVARHVVPTTIAALRKVLVSVRGRVTVGCEVGPMAAWLKRSLETKLRTFVVCDRRRTRLVARGAAKTDRIDADRLSQSLRAGTIHPIYSPDPSHRKRRELARHYLRMQRERARIIQRLQALFLESGVRMRAPQRAPVRIPVRRLIGDAAKTVARAYLQQLQSVSGLVAEARTGFLAAAATHPAYELLQSVPFIGEIRSATLIAVIGDPGRFRSRRKWWSYAGLAVIQNASAQHRVEAGRIVRNDKAGTARLSKAAQPMVKKVFRDIALYASVGRGPFRAIYEAHIARGKRPAVARVALARKIASVVLGVWRSGLPFNAELLRNNDNELRGEHRAAS
jgi:transposase